MAPIQGEDPVCPVSVCEHDKRRIREADFLVGVARNDLARDLNVLSIKRCELEPAGAHVIQDREFPVHPPSGERKVINFCQHKR